jgi:hypothetical protein
MCCTLYSPLFAGMCNILLAGTDQNSCIRYGPLFTGMYIILLAKPDICSLLYYWQMHCVINRKLNVLHSVQPALSSAYAFYY